MDVADGSRIKNMIITINIIQSNISVYTSEHWRHHNTLLKQISFVVISVLATQNCKINV